MTRKTKKTKNNSNLNKIHIIKLDAVKNGVIFIDFSYHK